MLCLWLTGASRPSLCAQNTHVIPCAPHMHQNRIFLTFVYSSQFTIYLYSRSSVSPGAVMRWSIHEICRHRRLCAFAVLFCQ